MTRWNLLGLIAIAITVPTTADAICYDPNTPDHRCDPRIPHPRPTPDAGRLYGSVRVFVDLGDSAIGAASVIQQAFGSDLPALVVEPYSVDGQSLFGLWEGASSAAQKSLRAGLIRSAGATLAGAEQFVFELSEATISQVVNDRARATRLQGGHVDDATVSLANNRWRTTIDLHVDSIPCNVRATQTHDEAIGVAAGRPASLSDRKSLYVNPGDVACDMLIPPPPIPTVVQAIRVLTSASGTESGVAAGFFKAFPTSLAFGTLTATLEYTSASTTPARDLRLAARVVGLAR
jgi:hypothetical protein